MTRRPVGEFDLIREIRQSLNEQPSHIIRGIGDDAAVYRANPGRDQIVTTDIMVEHVHFDMAYTPPDSLGWKALAINLSDIAAMGGEPRCAVVNLGLTGSLDEETILAIYEGLNRCGQVFNCPVIGGDTVKSPQYNFIGVTLIGEVQEGRAILRSGARIGDAICVTGDFGNARTGFEVLSEKTDPYAYPRSTLKFLEPTPQIRIAEKMIQSGDIHAMIDVSDGLASEMHHICRESRVGCRMDAETIPVSSECVRWCALKNQPLLPFALSSGEEYELLFTCSPGTLDSLKSMDCPVTRIGRIVPEEEGISLRESGSERPLENSGWDHFG